MKKGIRLLALATLAASACLHAIERPNDSGAKPEKVDVTARLVDEFYRARPIKRIEPKYPKTAARNGHEGWVKISYIVDKDGKVVDPFITDSMGSSAFKSAALSAIKKWKYDPALRNGEAIESCQNEVQLVFSISNQKLSRRFYSFYQSTNELLANNELDRAKEKLKNSSFLTKSNLLEQNYLSMLWADYYQKTNQPVEQLKHLYNVTSGVKNLHKDERFSADVHVFNLQQRFIADINTQRFASALDTYEGLSKFDTPQAEQVLQKLKPYFDEVKALKAKDKMIVHDGVIAEDGRWYHRLYKNGFALAEVDGDLAKLDIRCNGHHATYVPSADNHWKIPDSWGTCYLYIEGDEGAKFKLIETNKA